MVRCFFLSLLLCVALYGSAQPLSYSFRKLTTTDGLSDDIIRSMAQDKYGYLWIGTANGLTIYNGHDCRVIGADEIAPSGLRTTTVTTLCKDKEGTMWVGMPSGLYRYDYSSGKFFLQPSTQTLRIQKLFSNDNNLLYLLTNNGVKIYNTSSQKLQGEFSNVVTKNLLASGVHDVCALNNKTLCFATDTGLVVYHSLQQKAEILSLSQPLKNLSQVAADREGNIWCSSGTTLYQVKGKTVKTFLQLVSDAAMNVDNVINDLLVDNRGRLWAVSSRSGFSLYDEKSDRFVTFHHDPLQPQSLSSNLAHSLFQSSDGTVWIGTEGYGLNYFHPDQNFFGALLPSQQTPTLPDGWCRAVAEDAQGRWWIATANGVALYNPVTNTYQVFQNKNGEKKQLYSNSVRSVLCASDGTVWIGTAEGLNRYHPQPGVMDFLGEKEDLLQTFIWHLHEDNQHRIWIASRSGIYTFNPLTKKIDDNSRGPLASISRLRCRTLFRDAQNRLWLGFDGDGLACYDESKGIVKRWQKKDGDTTSLSNDYVISIAQDNEGAVWISTVSGLNRYNASTGNFQRYTIANGLPSARLSSLLADDSGRLWMGSSKGLCLLDKSRRYVQTFGEEDGLPSASFNDQSGCRLRNGLFVFPTVKGLVYFYPSLYQKEQAKSPTYLTAFRVNNRSFPLGVNSEAVKEIDLKWDQSFFSFTVASCDYLHPKGTTYAYWLEGFDKGWVYTKERTRNYTNVPGENYVLHLKSTSNVQDWNVPETIVAVHVGTVFYKTAWFIVLLSAMFLFALYAIYRYRLNQHHRLMALQTKATALEKEKTLALYESLKQQLNPHFLFNSLSSLNGLIRKDPEAASAFLNQLSKIYRYILKSRDTETVRVSEDLKLTQTYVQLQQTRFGSGLQLNVAVSEEALNKRLAPVTIQNLVENAIKHNVIDPETPLCISVTDEGDFLVVQNNLQKKVFVESSNKQGLQSMNTLCRYLTGRSLLIEETEKTFTVKVPLL